MVENNLIQLAREQMGKIITNAVNTAMGKGELPGGELPSFVVEIPSDTSHGDFATNIAMVGAKSFKMAPPKIAQIILDNVNFADSYFTEAKTAGPGFINFFLNHKWFSNVVENIETLGEKWGETDFGKGKKVLVEFVSANPTGPMHLGNARGGVIGDSLASALNAAGFKADREFYLNDAGNQIEKFGESLEARYIQEIKEEDAIAFPEDGYHGDDITVRVKEYIAEKGDGLIDMPNDQVRKALIDYVLPKNVSAMEKTLEKYRIVYDTWFKESTLHNGAIDEAIKMLEEKGLTYELDGATWYKATEMGEEKDEVLVRNNGAPTYFAADIAYHYNKFATRGYEVAIDLWGADHHGHVARMKNAMDAIGLKGDNLDILLFQLIRLLKNGEPFKMSKRAGETVTLDELLEMVPVDAARFFFNMRESGSAMDFDLDLAVEETSSNPVFYVQYAPARIHSILKRVKAEGVEIAGKTTEKELQLLTHPSELALIRKLAQYPEIIINVAKRHETSVLTHYAVDVANDFHKFYNDCRVLVEDRTKDYDLMQARISLCNATIITLTNLLGLLKINVPQSM